MARRRKKQPMALWGPSAAKERVARESLLANSVVKESLPAQGGRRVANRYADRRRFQAAKAKPTPAMPISASVEGSGVKVITSFSAIGFWAPS